MNIRVAPLNYKHDWGWVRDKLPLRLVEDTCGFVAFDADTGKHLGAIVIDNITNNSCTVSLIIDNPMILRHKFLEQGFCRIFDDFDLQYIYAMVAETNLPSRKITERMSFKEKMRMPEAYSDGVDYIVYEVKRDNCEFYQKMRGAEDGQRRQES